MITSAAPGERVEYIGELGFRGLAGTIEGRSSVACKGGCPKVVVVFDDGRTLDMCVTVLQSKQDTERTEEMAKPRKTVVTHPDGTESTRGSASNVYTHAVEVREDMWVSAKRKRAEADDKRAERARFVAAVRAGKVAVRDKGTYDSVYLLGEGGEEWWLGSNDAAIPGVREAKTLDRKAAIRKALADIDRQIATSDSEADAEEAGPQYRYGVARWSMSAENAGKARADFERRFANIAGHSFRVVPAEEGQ